MKIKKKQKRNYFKILLWTFIAGLIVWGLFALFAELSKPKKLEAEIKDNDSSKIEEVNKKRKNENDEDNEKPADGGSDIPEAPQIDPSDHKKMADVKLTRVEISDDKKYVEVEGMIMNAIDRSGICTYILSGPKGTVLEISSSPLPSPSSTVCASIKEDINNFTKGSWKAKLNYSSNNVKGESDEISFKVD